ncbi:MAG: glycosyltransferase family 2 protein, partial [Selenomonas sp.]|nr:glycosyltransferase family 2 protein [Selenomonas sp.]
MKSVSIVVPVYNEGENILHFTDAVREVMDKQPYKWNLLFVDDGSKDNSLELLEKLQTQHENIKVLALSHNCGHQIALTCGLDHATGDAVISMDGDMQHPPALIPELLAKWEDGYEIVQTIRQDTQGVSWLKKQTSNLYYRLINNLSSVHIRPGGSDFRLLDRRAVNAMNKYREHDRFLRGIVTLLGFN